MKVNCGNPQLPSERFTVSLNNGTLVGAVAAYGCQEGYVFQGDRYSVCQSNGLWSSVTSQCLSNQLMIYTC